MSINRSAVISESYEGTAHGQEDNNQDWVCIKCNNLNFSFRKKCNRCKSQSRQDNMQSLYVDYYYQQYYQYSIQPFKHNINSQNLAQPTSNTIKTPIKNSNQEKQSSPQAETSKLPSVSPLIKKYKDSKERDIFDSTKICHKDEMIWKLFGQQIWNTVQFSYIDLKNYEKENINNQDEEISKEFIKSVQKMII